MDNEELLVVIKALDKIMTSERAEIKSAFRELMIMATLCENSNGVTGPLQKLVTEVTNMKHQMNGRYSEEDRYRKMYETQFRNDRYYWNDVWNSNQNGTTVPGHTNIDKTQLKNIFLNTPDTKI